MRWIFLSLLLANVGLCLFGGSFVQGKHVHMGRSVENLESGWLGFSS